MDARAKWTGPAILHVDMDAFFAAVEQLDDPSLRGKPVIVGSPHGRGVVATCSYEARVFGVRSAMPSARAAKLCPDAIWVRGNFERYGEMSAMVRAIFRDITPHVQPVSIDEAFLDVTPGAAEYKDPVEAAREIQRRVDELGITCSIGVAASKTVAKIASDQDKPHGITVVRPGEEAAFLGPLPIGRLSGVGPKTAAALQSRGIRTLAELAALDETTARHLLGQHGPALTRRAAGIDTGRVHAGEAAKSVSAERTFAEDVRTAGDIDAAIRSLAERVAGRLRRGERPGRTVTVKVRFADFTTRTVQRTLPHPSDDAMEIHAIAMVLLRTVWRPGVGVRLFGVGVSGFGEVETQLDLLSAEDAPAAERATERRRRLTEGVDAVRERFGSDAVRRGRELKPPPQPEGDD